MKRLIIILYCITLMSCSLLSPKPEVIIKPTPVFPPESLMKDCNKSKLEGNTFKDVINLTLNLSSDIDECNINMKSLREWKNRLNGVNKED